MSKKLKYFLVIFLFIFNFAKADKILPFQAGQGFDEKYLWGEANSDKKKCYLKENCHKMQITECCRPM